MSYHILHLITPGCSLSVDRISKIQGFEVPTFWVSLIVFFIPSLISSAYISERYLSGKYIAAFIYPFHADIHTMVLFFLCEIEVPRHPPIGT